MKVYIANHGKRESCWHAERLSPADVEVEVDAATVEHWRQLENAYWDMREQVYWLAVAEEEREDGAGEAALETVPVRLECGHEGVMPEDEIHTQIAWCGRCSRLQGFTVIPARVTP